MKNIIVLIIVLLSSAALYFMKCHYRLPLIYNKASIDSICLEEHVVYKNRFNNDLIVHAPTSGPMAFSSSYNYLGLYNENGFLEDEINIGNSAPFKLNIWDKKEIIIEIIEKQNQLTNEHWLKDKNKLGHYKLKFIY
jgi:hypothetical protein